MQGRGGPHELELRAGLRLGRRLRLGSGPGSGLRSESGSGRVTAKVWQVMVTVKAMAWKVGSASAEPKKSMHTVVAW